MWIEPVILGGGSAIENVGPVAGIFGAEKLFVEPGLGPALFDLLRLVGLGNFPGHEFLMVLNFVLRSNNQYKRRARGASIGAARFASGEAGAIVGAEERSLGRDAVSG